MCDRSLPAICAANDRKKQDTRYYYCTHIIAQPIELTRAAPLAFSMEHQRHRSVHCRVGAGVTPDAPHGPVREQLTHTVRQCWPWRTNNLAVDETTRRMTVAAHPFALLAPGLCRNPCQFR